MNYSERMELRQKAVEKLAEHGVWMARTSTMQQIAEQVEIVTGVKQRRSQMVSDYLYRWLDTKPEPVNPRYRPEFRPLRLVRHPRADDIQRAQPPLWTPKGIGNVKQLGGFIPDVWRL